MTAIDTSVCIPALLADHQDHDPCRRAAAGCRIPSHALTESYAVLTRLPDGRRLDHEIAATLLNTWFPAAAVLAAPASLQRALVRRLSAAGVSGGASYDAMVGLVAAVNGEELLTRDVRAIGTYEALGVAYRIVPDGNG